MSLITQCLPEVSFREVQRIAVEAAPELAYLRLRAVDLNEVQFIRRLMRVRALPARMRAWWRGFRRTRPTGARIDDLITTVAGLSLLGERPGEEIVLGAIGKLWQPVRALEPVPPSRFRDFAQPGFGKLALSLRVAPRAFGGSWISIELRGAATDAASEPHMRCAWQIMGRLMAAISARILQRLAADLGPLVEDEELHLPGDALLQQVPFQLTHALTIEAPTQQVWRWLLDTGAAPAAVGSAGLERQPAQPELGARLPGLLDHLGDFVVVRGEPARLLVLGDASLLPEAGQPAHPAAPRGVLERMVSTSIWSTTWAFVLSPIGDDATRLVIRVRSRWEQPLGMGLLEPLMTAIHDALERRLLDSLCRQAETFDKGRAA